MNYKQGLYTLPFTLERSSMKLLKNIYEKTTRYYKTNGFFSLNLESSSPKICSVGGRPNFDFSAPPVFARQSLHIFSRDFGYAPTFYHVKIYDDLCGRRHEL